MPKNDHTVTLSVEERYALGNMLPTTGNFITMTMSKNTLAVLELSPHEVEEWGYKKGPGGRGWVPVDVADDNAFQQKASITLTEKQWDNLKQLLEDANKADKLQLVHIRLYELIVRESDRAEEDAALAEAEATLEMPKAEV